MAFLIIHISTLYQQVTKSIKEPVDGVRKKKWYWFPIPLLSNLFKQMLLCLLRTIILLLFASMC